MERLTQKNEFFEYVLPCQNVVGDNRAYEISLGETEYTCKKYIIGEAIKKIGELEDVLEKYGIETTEELDGVLKPLIDNGELENWKSATFWKMQTERLKQENQQLKQQLHDLPKKIMEDIEKNFTEYLPLKDKTGAGFYSRLNTILKKYGGENE